MINFATSLVGHWYGGLGLAAVLACALFAAISGSSPATRRGDRLDHDAGDGQGGLPAALRRRRHHHLGRARHPDPAVDRDGDVLGRRPTPRSARLFIAGVDPRHRPGRRCSASRPGTARARTTTRACRAPAGASAGRRSAKSVWGLLLIVVVIGGIYSGMFTPTEAAAMAAVYAFFIAVFVYKDLKLTRRAARAAAARPT